MNALERALLQRVLELEEHVRLVERGNLELQAEVATLKAAQASVFGMPGPVEKPPIVSEWP